MEVKELNPKVVWSYFDRITTIPRPSKKEEKIVAFLMQFAQEQGLEAKQDKALNVVIAKPATPGYETRKTVILQSHVDMVAEKNSDVPFNFETDAINTYIDDGWVKAQGTTLGADDGIGVAAALAILASKEIEHGPIRCLFTTDEETGLTGANALEPAFLEGDILVNLDSEDWGEFCIGCAGGKNTIASLPYKALPVPASYFWFEFTVAGLKGGHSGSEIHYGLGNANKILTRYLYTLMQHCPVVVAEIDGGNLHNAIAREARALVGVPLAKKETTIVQMNLLQADLLNELPAIDQAVKLNIRSADAPKLCLDIDTTNTLIEMLYALPHGVMGWSHTMAGTVETSTNLASVKMTEGKIRVTTSQRSSTDSLKDDTANMVTTVFRLAGATAKSSDGYPGWTPNADSEILKVSKEVYRKLFKEEPRVISIHAGLECGLFFEKNPSLDMISCGPTILAPHSPDERIEIATVEKWWSFLLEVLKSIPTK